jgi:segregation and condensation protein B
MDELEFTAPAEAADDADSGLRAAIEAIVYVTEEPVTPAQIAAALGRSEELVKSVLEKIATEYESTAHGIAVREIAGGYKMATKAEHHETIRHSPRASSRR